MVPFYISTYMSCHVVWNFVNRGDGYPCCATALDYQIFGLLSL